MLYAALCGVYPGGVYIGVAKDICQTEEVLFQRIKKPGKQVAQIVWEHFLFVYPGLLA